MPEDRVPVEAAAEFATSDGAAMATTEAEKPCEAETGETGGSENAGARVASPTEDKDGTIASLREQLLRMQADFENYKRRKENNLEEDRLMARERILRNLLPLLDNLERALAALSISSDVEALAEGLRLILRQMKDAMGNEGLVEIVSDGEIFDPARHEAVVSEERDDVADQTVIETLQKGYRLGNRTVRPSLVKVARATASEGV